MKPPRRLIFPILLEKTPFTIEYSGGCSSEFLSEAYDEQGPTIDFYTNADEECKLEVWNERKIITVEKLEKFLFDKDAKKMLG